VTKLAQRIPLLLADSRGFATNRRVVPEQMAFEKYW
jgi:hypothetical protein